MSESWYKKICDEKEDIRESIRLLLSLSGNLKSIGMDGLARNLKLLSLNIDDSLDKIENILGNHIDTEFKKVQKGISDTLNALCKNRP